MKTKSIILMIVISFLFVGCMTEVFIEFYAELSIEFKDENLNRIENVDVTLERIFKNEKTGIIYHDDNLSATGIFLLILNEGNAASRYHAEKPVELSVQEQSIKVDHEYYCIFEKEGYVKKDTTIIIKNNEKLNIVIKLEKIK